MTIHEANDKGIFTDRYAILCNYADGGCGAESGWRKLKEEVIEIWNRRAK